MAPHLVIGDMDSLPHDVQAELLSRGCQFVIHPRAKDETDLELALHCAVQRKAQEIIILGALGGRLDHTVANLLLLTMTELAGIPVRIIGANQEALLLRGGGTGSVQGRPGDLVSLLPLGGEAIGVTTAGLAWALSRETLHFGLTRGLSNEMVSAIAEIQLEGGYLLVVHSWAVG
jgi:thiamine pyrophosphokinase